MYTFLPSFWSLPLTAYWHFFMFSFREPSYLHTLQQSLPHFNLIETKQKIVRTRKTGSNESISKLKGDALWLGYQHHWRKKEIDHRLNFRFEILIRILVDMVRYPWNTKRQRLAGGDMRLSIGFYCQSFRFFTGGFRVCLQVSLDEDVEQSIYIYIYEDKKREVERNY